MSMLTGLVGIGDLIELRDDRGGRPYVAGTGISVGHIGMLWVHGHSPEEIADHVLYGITLPQVLAALSYFTQNRAVIEADLVAQDEHAERNADEMYATRAVRER